MVTTPRRLPPPQLTAFKKVPWFLGLIASASFAVGAAPDAGSLLNQIRRSLPAPTLPTVGPDPVPASVAEVVGQGRTFVAKQFVFEGNTLVPASELAVALRSYLGRPLTIQELRNAAAEIALVYRARGYVAAASVPRQDVTAGVVRMVVAEGWFGYAKVDASSRGRIAPEELVARVTAPQGAPVNVYDLDRSLLIMNDLPGVVVRGALSAGETAGQTNLVIVSDAAPLLAGSLTADDFGPRSTGEARAVVGLRVSELLRLGDQFSLDGLHTEGSDYFRVGAALPVGVSGARLSVGLSHLDYRVVSSAFASSEARGNSTTASLDLTYPVLRSKGANLYASIGLESKGFFNEAAGTVTSDYASRSVQLKFDGNLYDGWCGGGVNSASVGVTFGRLDLAGSPNQSSDASGPGTDGAYAKLNYSLSRSQELGTDWQLALSVSGQLAFANLDSSEKLFLGGSSGVRAFPASEGVGDSGVLGALELRRQLTTGLSGSLFVDAGLANVTAKAYAGAPARNELTYQGWGVGLAYVTEGGCRCTAQWSHRLGSNPNPQANGNDQDGTLLLNRFWLSAAFNF